MERTCSAVSEAYLHRFSEILDTMIKDMTSAQLTDSISHNFIVQMIPHHMAAIEMCRNLLQYTTCVPLERIASDIITEQTQSIADMRRVLQTCGQQCNTEAALVRYGQRFGCITRTMFSRMRNAPRLNDINRSFMLEMIPHHCGAISMSESALEFSICRQLDPILQAIIVSQKRGVAQMERLLRR